ncbi:YitT family protein [Ideonella sp. BN130291]|uniref:YitT family protein n=1 Tax=Ideonella sp. BN130291 TaxID=3112940 RepID=UPI002E266CED|nr:YitT family protein [Ideonella sp. BN130291]
MNARLDTPSPQPHSLLDDAQAFGTALLFIALGLSMVGSAGLLTGGTPGLAFLLHYATGMRLGVALLAVNLPFYLLAWHAMGRRFTLKTLLVVTGLSVAVEAMVHLLSFQTLQPLFAAVAGGTLIGAGLLVLFRHHASLGGIGVLALQLEKRRGWRAGWVQMAIDACIVATAFAVVEPRRVLYSLAGTIAVNLVLALNHRPGRYVASRAAQAG